MGDAMKRAKLSAKSEALAFRIWAYASPIGWDCTIHDVAQALGVSARSVGAVALHKRWSERFRRNAEQAVSEAWFGEGLGFLNLEAFDSRRTALRMVGVA